MKRINKKLFWITALVVLLPLFLGLALWNRLPDVMTTHWNAAGEADGHSGKAFAVFFTPLFLLLMHLVCVGATLLDDGSQPQSPKVLSIAYWAMPVVSLYAGTMIYGTALGLQISLFRFMAPLMGLLLIVIGNYMPKARQNKAIGVRLPWTLNDPENWHKTHRFAGKAFIIGGAVLILCVLLPTKAQFIALMAVLLVLLIAVTVYSYRLHKKKQSKPPA